MKSTLFTISLLTLFIFGCTPKETGHLLTPDKSHKLDNDQIVFPRPFFVAIDDIGWNMGKNDGILDGVSPFRIGLDRKLKLSDYKCLVDVAKKIGVRLQGLFVLGDMDRNNVLATVPSTNPLGSKWKNESMVSDEQITIMQFVKDNAAWLEFGLHGVYHEHWPQPQVRKRAEWYCTTDNHPWKKKVIAGHIKVYKDLMNQYGMGDEFGHSFPESFVPCAYAFHWNPDGDYSTGQMLGDAGVKYANTLFSYVEELNPPKDENGGGLDHSMLVVNRINYGNPWYQLASLPTTPVENQKSDIIETHWTNWLTQDVFLQENLNNKWIEYFRNVEMMTDRYPAKNTEQFSSQWLYKKYTTVSNIGKGNVKIDNTAMPQEVYDNNLLSTLILKIKLPKDKHISQVMLDGKTLSCYYEQGGFGMITVPKLLPKTYQLTFKVGSEYPPLYLENLGTYNVYDFTVNQNKAFLKLRLYGTQILKFHGLVCPINISSDNPDIRIINKKCNGYNNEVILTVSAHDIQGETGTLTLTF